MQVVTTLVLLVTCELCLTIRVPVAWDESASEVKQEIQKNNDEQFSVESFKPQNFTPLNVNVQDDKPIPVEYFQYTAKKPQFAIDVAKFHGVQSPENHYKAYPIKPYTDKSRPELGKHQLLQEENSIHRPLQEFANINEDVVRHAVPVTSNYEVFHPYEAEIPALQEIYKDPILTKIRTDLENSKNRLQSYEKETGESDIHSNEYLESPKKTDDRFIPHRNIPAPYEIHRPQRRPIYYRPVLKNYQREQYLNQRLRHPWNQYSAKIRPIHYRPIKNHIHQLRQNHALKYDDERNEYPQVHVLENYSSDPKDGYDIYEKGKDKFVQLRNNVDESINKAVEENRPKPYQKLEMQNDDYVSNDDNEEEFVPIKNYAQVRKSETFKHLPRSAALADAKNFDEIYNAPRLKEAVKSTKAQTVYTEEGYEDSAYDHAGEQKHASENEGHGGYLKEHELSGGKYKTPSEKEKYQDAGGSAHRDEVIHAEKWKEENKDNIEETGDEDYSEDEHEKSIEADQDSELEDENHRNKRDSYVHNKTDVNSSSEIKRQNETSAQHDVEKRNANFKVPELDLNSTFLTEEEILKLAKIKMEPQKDDIKQKYPYYFKNLKAINKHSPLRYAENLKFIPKKSNGGTEFYDSRSKFQCPEVDDAPDPLPEKLKRDGHPDDHDEDEKNSSKKGDENYDTAQKAPRLKGLGDKIDCFKSKYFGENPLDSPFFKEDIISNPEPLSFPNVASYKLKTLFDNKKSKDVGELDISGNQKKDENPNIFDLIEKLKKKHTASQGSVIQSRDRDLVSSLLGVENSNNTNGNSSHQQSSVFSDVLGNIKNKLKSDIFSAENSINITNLLVNAAKTPYKDNVTYRFFQNIEDVTQLPPKLRKKRSNTFVYEPYKIIRDSAVQDSKKTTTTNNISPLIRQLQSSRFVDKVPISNQETEQSEKQVKRNVNTRVYKDIGKTDRVPSGSKNDKGSIHPDFVDVSVDSRRGEPRYEIRHTNHKSRYTPVENKTSMSIKDYHAKTGTDKTIEIKSRGETNIPQQSRQKTTLNTQTSNSDIQNVAASSNTVQKTMITTTVKPTQQPNKKEHYIEDDNDSEEDYEEYDDEVDDKKPPITTTTTTTRKPIFRRRVKLLTTTEKISESTEKPKLTLVTRFRDYKPDEKSDRSEESPAKPKTRSRVRNNDKTHEHSESIPKYREKKKKSSKSTLVTDTKRYGDDDDDDMRKEEVDAMIGVKQDMSDYMPLYEKEEEEKLRKKSLNKDNLSENDSEENDETENDPNKDSNDNDTNEDDDDEDIDDDSDDNDDDNDDRDDDDTDEEDENDDENEDTSELESQVTTPEPTKRTLPVTTDAPIPTIASRKSNPEAKPVITRRKIEIHKELPVNKAAPHVTQFKQDIKEVEIVKEIPVAPRKKPQKNLEALELFKDDNLAKDVNKLGVVEVFKKNIDLRNGPKHGGNYRSIDDSSTASPLKETRNTAAKGDTDTSQSEFTKQIELDDDVPSHKMHGGNLKSLRDHKTKSRSQNAKLIEFNDPPITMKHGGNLKHRSNDPSNIGKSQKLIELDDDDDDEHNNNDPRNDHESFSNTRNSPMHGGNYRRAKLVAEEKPEVTEQPIRNKAKGARRTSAAILSSFVQAAPILTTTPVYILDPSKRMYYYVDA